MQLQVADFCCILPQRAAAFKGRSLDNQFAMKQHLLLFFFALSVLSAQAQRITGYQVLPVNATANDNLKLVLAVYFGNCTNTYGYTVTRTNSVLEVKACYGNLGVAMPCTRYDTLALGRLPAGSYSVTTASYIVPVNATTGCATSTLAPITNAAGSFAVSTVLATATRSPLERWQVAPTVLATSPTVLHLSETPVLSQAFVYDVAGRVQHHFTQADLTPQQGRLALPLPSAAPGLYLLRVVDATGQTSTRRFVRQ